MAEAALGRGLAAGTPLGEGYQVIVHVDAPVLADPASPGRSELDDGQAVPAETCRRIACDAPHVMVTHGQDGDVLNVGCKARKISLPLWRALAARDRTCRFPGCTRTGRLQAHHIEHWAQGGETSPDNLILLCKAHHWAVHEGGVRIEGRPPGPITFVRPDGRLLPASPPRVVIRGDGAELLRQAPPRPGPPHHGRDHGPPSLARRAHGLRHGRGWPDEPPGRSRTGRRRGGKALGRGAFEDCGLHALPPEAVPWAM